LRILCTNDDGIQAEGLAVLEKIAQGLSADVWTIAPEQEQSGASRALSLSAPIRVREIGAKRYAVSGTPTDCVLLGVHELMKEGAPDLVLSGVNRGQNIADDVTFSGTIAGAMQGMQLGIRSIALSQARGLRDSGAAPASAAPWAMAQTFGPGIVRTLIQMAWPPGVFMNVNFPDRDPAEGGEVEATAQAARDRQVMYFDKRTDLRGGAYYWLGFRSLRSTAHEGGDLKAIYDGKISVTPLHADLTHRAALHDLKAALGGSAPKR
jgi:5'-nucleotidase